jgi:hypothetical protein
MIQKIRRIILSAVAATALLMPLAVPVVAHADASNDTNLQGSLSCGTDININDSSCQVGDTTSSDTVNHTVQLALNLFSAIVGIIAVVMIIVGGIRYITSGGDSGNVTAAKNTILYAVIGLIVVALAQIIVKFVLTRFVSSS